MTLPSTADALLHRRRHPSSAGFGLIEVLVVLVILMILAAIILPRLTGGRDALTGKKNVSPRERAREVVGVEYIGQINQAIAMYRMDNDGRNPPTLFELKRYGVTNEMLLDPNTRKPLSYDPRTGAVGNSRGVSRGPDSLGGGTTLPQVGGPGGVTIPQPGAGAASAVGSDGDE
jgi:type II secretory pathway pseudopilin PulG